MRKIRFQIRKEFIHVLLGKVFHDAFEMVHMAGWPMRQFHRKIKGYLVLRHVNAATELVCTGKFLLPRRRFLIFHGEYEGPAVRIASAPCIPVFVGNGAETGIFFRQAFQRRVDGLLLRTDETDLHAPFLQSEDLGSEHGRIGDADELELFVFHIGAGNDKEPWPVRGTVYVCCLDLPIDTLFLCGEMIKIHLACRRKCFNDVFEGIPVDPVQEIEDLDGDFRVREKKRIHVALAQIFRYGVVVREVAVMNKRFVEAYEWMSAAGMPHTALGRVALMGNPDMGVEVLKPIILGHLLGVTDNLQDHHVPAMRENKGLLVAQGAVKGEIQLIGILIDAFFFRFIFGERFKFPLLLECCQGFRSDADKITFYLRGLYLKPFDITIIVHGIDESFMIDPKKGFNEPCFEFGKDCFVEKSDLEEKILIEGLLINTQFLRSKTYSGKTAALAVSAIVHLD